MQPDAFKQLDEYEDINFKYFKLIKRARGVLQPDVFKKLDEYEDKYYDDLNEKLERSPPV